MPRFTVQRTVLPGTLVGAVVAVGSGLCNGLTPVVDAWVVTTPAPSTSDIHETATAIVLNNFMGFSFSTR
jgi:hypothetical protein